MEARLCVCLSGAKVQKSEFLVLADLNRIKLMSFFFRNDYILFCEKQKFHIGHTIKYPTLQFQIPRTTYIQVPDTKIALFNAYCKCNTYP